MCRLWSIYKYIWGPKYTYTCRASAAAIRSYFRTNNTFHIIIKAHNNNPIIPKIFKLIEEKKNQKQLISLRAHVTVSVFWDLCLNKKKKKLEK